MSRHHRRTRGGASEHDHGYKRLFAHPTAVEELLRGFLREDWVDRLDFSTLKRMGNSFVSDTLRERHNDVIWRLRFRGDPRGWFYVYLLLEFQSTPYHFMAVRLLSYLGLLFEEIIREEKLRTGDRLPPVLPIVVYNGKRPWNAPRSLGSLYASVPDDLRRRLPELSYVLLDENSLDLQNPELAGNRVAALFRLETCTEALGIPALTRRLATLLPPGEEPELRQTINIWVRSILRRTFPGITIPEVMDLEEVAMLEENMRDWARKNRQEGEVIGMRKLLLRLLTARFGRLPLAARRQVEAISSAADLQRLAERIMTAGSLQDLGLT